MSKQLPPQSDPDRRVRIKVCGLTTPGDARMAADAGAHWIGLNFHPPSPRFVADDGAAAIMAALPESTRPVGLFVDRPPAEIAARAGHLGLRIVQLHGDEPPEDVADLNAAGLCVVRAFRLKDPGSITRMVAYLGRCADLGASPVAVLVDAYVVGRPGGTGTMIDNELLECLPHLPHLILAGGLSPANVADQVKAVRPWMVDVAGGVESQPGRKDPEKIAAFVREALSGCSRP